MHKLPKLAIAALLITATTTVAAAQNQRRTPAPQRVQPAQTAPLVSTDPYGERPTSPGAVPCSERPFAPGCDKRGFW